MKLFTIITLLSLLGKISMAQKQKFILDAASKVPIEFANVLSIKLRTGVISTEGGVIKFDDKRLIDSDTITISHVSYKPLNILYKLYIQIDTIFLSPQPDSLLMVYIKPNINTTDYQKENSFGFFSSKYNGSLWMRYGEQVGLVIDNKDKIQGLISQVRLHFEKILPNASFRIRIKKLQDDGSFGDDLLPNGIVFKPSKMKTTIDLLEYKLLFPKNGVFVDVMYLGDGSSYPDRMNSPHIMYRLTTRKPGFKTYTNLMDAYKWNRSSIIHPKEIYPQNAQIQITVLSK